MLSWISVPNIILVQKFSSEMSEFAFHFPVFLIKTKQLRCDGPIIVAFKNELEVVKQQ